MKAYQKNENLLIHEQDKYSIIGLYQKLFQNIKDNNRLLYVLKGAS